eukprot:15120701-Ditylum_brightwellii.AAC.1
MMVNNINVDSNDVQIQWDRNNDWSQLEHEYDDEFLTTSASRAYEDLMNISTSNYMMRQLSTHTPSGQSSNDGGSDVGRLQILLGQGGGGKSYAIDTILTTSTSEHNFIADNNKVCTTTGKAAILIG